MNENPLNKPSLCDYLRIQRSPEGEILYGECEWPACGKQFSHSLDQETAEQQLYDQHKEHMRKEHVPFDG